MTQLQAIFAKPVNRPIEGVIKADDNAHLRLEVEEYVLTNEISKRLNRFLAAYTDYQGANGVWISGFFGSGKSHLLKMLSLLLENEAVDGISVLEAFENKIGADDVFLKGDMRRAVSIPSRSILFNIDQKADVISKKEVDALLAVFVKVFDEMCGYYGKQGHIAQFERDLDSRGQYTAFKAAYEEVAGQTWAFGREQAILEGANITKAYARVTGETDAGVGILDKYRATYKLSIEDFAEQVNAYIEAQVPGFRLNFFVDEVGQYVANNVKLMTNLQTVAESLATKCRGRAWVIVTAQEEMNTVVGALGGQQSNDFSKIQDRFATRMKLTSADVEEVIIKRLLAKNALGETRLKQLYAQQQNNFDTLFTFGSDTQSYRSYRDESHFVGCYPFVGYQFPLFQAAIQNLSLHNAFEGRHSSVGERSMLGVFQDVAKTLAECEIGELATFDLMFEGVRSALKSGIQQAVTVAEKQLDDPFAVRLLKALLLVKYVKEFKATPRNLTVLLLPGFDADVVALRERIETALNLLEQQAYVQRNGDVYEYLTNEEKDVEMEIKNVEISTDKLLDYLAQLVFDQTLRDRRIRYTNGQDYNFTRKLDGRINGRESELAIHVISPYNEHADNLTVLRSQAMGRDELLVILPPDPRLMIDLLLYQQTDKYIRQNYTTTQQENVKRILDGKRHQNREREQRLQNRITTLLGEAQLIAASHDVATTSNDAQTRIIAGFHDLIGRTYTNLRMLRGVTYRESDIVSFLNPAATLGFDATATLSEAELEIRNHITSEAARGLRPTLQSVLQRFERKPYGWYLAAIQCITAKLVGVGQIELWRDGEILEQTADLAHALRNTKGFGNVQLTPQEVIPSSKLRALKEFYSHFFDQPVQLSEARALGTQTATAFTALQSQLADLYGQRDDYPFLSALAEPLALLNEVSGKRYSFYFGELDPFIDDLEEAKEGIIDPIRRFMGGSQKALYREAAAFLRDNRANLSHSNDGGPARLQALLDDPAIYRGNQMQGVKRLLDGLRQQVTELVAQEREQAQAWLDERWAQLAAEDMFDLLTIDQQQRLQAECMALRNAFEREPLVAVIRERRNDFERETYPGLLSQMAAWAHINAAPAQGDDDEDGAQPAPQIAYVSMQSLRIVHDRHVLMTEEDVDAYLAAWKERLMAAIRDGQRIQL